MSTQFNALDLLGSSVRWPGGKPDQSTKDETVVRLEHVSKAFGTRNGQKIVADDISFALPKGRSVALIGRNGAGKSTLLRMIAGTLRPDAGQITRTGRVSWPVGFGGAFHGDLSGAQNTRFVARSYGVDSDALIDLVHDMSELGESFHEPVRSYSTGMRARLAFSISMGVPSDVYLVDEITAVGDARFRKTSRRIFADRLTASSAIVVNHDVNQLREFCNAGMVLHNGKLSYFSDLNEAIEFGAR